MTFRSKVLARTSSGPQKPLFWAILTNLPTSGWVVLTEMVKRHIYGPRPFIWAYNQISMTIRSKVLARTRKRWQTDGQTDGHPNSIGPQLLGWGLTNAMRTWDKSISWYCSICWTFWGVFLWNVVMCISQEAFLNTSEKDPTTQNSKNLEGMKL